jgi:D-glycero-alpha-D-manno-heptose-7-phosphate kinase
MSMIVRAKAPLRISFAGGGTDVSPYMEERGGAVLSTTIDKYAYSTLRLREDVTVTLTSLDYDVVAKYRIDQPVSYDGKLDLVKAVVKELGTNQKSQGMDIFLHTDAPPGSGLGSSSALVVSLIGLFKHWQHLPLTHYEIAERAYQIERVDMGIQGGRQDQYAATFGGFNFIEFSKDAVIVNPLRIAADVLNELHYNMLLCYTGSTRLSARIIETQVQGYIHRDPNAVAAMDELKQIARDLKNALLQGRLDDFGDLLHAAWLNKKQMASQISNPHIEALYEAARVNGALGGKITGAGGGGYMFFYCEFGKKHVVAEKLEQLGAQVVDFNFDASGLQTWGVRGKI